MSAPATHSLRPALTLTMAATTGLAVANIYYNQPMLGLIERDLPGTAAGFVPTVTQLGYALGLFLLVPLGDLVERRRLIVAQFLALAVALAGAALAPSGSVLLLGSLMVGRWPLWRSRSCRWPRIWPRPQSAAR
jgi:MFS family permease